MHFNISRKCIHAICLVLLPWSTSHAVNNKSLMDIYTLALEQDAQFSAELSQADAVRLTAGFSRSGLLPSASISGQYGYSYNDVDYTSGSSTDYLQRYQSQSISLQVSQPLLRMDNIFAYRRDRVKSEIAQLDEEISNQTLLQRVTSVYFGILQEIENLEVEKARKSAFAENLEKANISFKLGAYTITDKLEAQARYDLANSDAIETLNRLQQKKEALRVLVGNIYELQPLDDATALPALTPDDVKYWQDQALDGNLHLKRMRALYKFSQRDVSAQKAGFLPKLDLVGSASYSTGIGFSGDDLVRNDATVAVRLDMPLLSGGESTSRLRELNAIKRQQRHLLDLQERQTALTAQVTFMKVVNGFSRLRSLHKALDSSQSAMEATRKGVEVGIRTTLDLLNAQQQMFETKRDYINLRYDYLYGLLDLKAVTGKLSKNDLIELDKLFQ